MIKAGLHKQPNPQNL